MWDLLFVLRFFFSYLFIWPLLGSNSATELCPSWDIWALPAHFTRCNFFAFWIPQTFKILEGMAMSWPFLGAWPPSQTLALKGLEYTMAELHWTDCQVGHYAAHSQNSPYLAYIKPSYNCLFKGRNIPSRWKSSIPLWQALFLTLVTWVSTSLVWFPISGSYFLVLNKSHRVPKIVLSDLCVMERTLAGESGD